MCPNKIQQGLSSVRELLVTQAQGPEFEPHVKSRAQGHTPVTLKLGRQRQRSPWGLLTSQSN